MTQRVKAIGSAVRETQIVQDDWGECKNLIPRSASDPMRLYPLVLKELDNYFSKRSLKYLSGQRELLSHAVEAVLQAAPGTVTAIPFQPGLGKSTLIRALLKVLSLEFQQNTLIAQTIGGVIIAVEKTVEAEELELLCNGNGEQEPVARAISSPNDYIKTVGSGKNTVYIKTQFEPAKTNCTRSA